MTTKLYCTAPFNGLHVDVNGMVQTCCKGEIDLLDLSTDGVTNLKMKLSQSSLLDIQKSMLEDKPHNKNCNFCANFETSTGTGHVRHQFNTVFPKIEPDKLITFKNVLIRFNNLCNLSCVYCGPNYSSVWEERLQIPIKITKVKNYQEELLNLILEYINEIEEIQLQGGEPMLIKQNYSLFSRLPLSSRIIIQTNLSYDLEKLPCLDDLLKRPKENVLWALSLENINDQFEYVRNGANWSQWLKNVNYLLKHWPDSIHVNFVYHTLSAFDILDTVKQLSYLGIFKYQFESVCPTPYHKLNVFDLSKELKEIAAHKFKEAFHWYTHFIHPDDRHLYYWQGASEILNILEESKTPALISKKEFYQSIQYLDNFSSKKFSDLWPDLKSLIDLYLPYK